MKLSHEQVIQALSVASNIKDAAKSLNLNYTQLIYFINRHNIDHKFKKHKINQTPEEIENLYNELGSLSKVADKIGSSKDGIRHFMKRHNLFINELKKYKYNKLYFNNTNEKSMYWAGFIAADGCVKHRGKRFELSIGLSRNDKCHLEQFKNDIEYNGLIRDYLVKNSKRNPKWNDSWKSELSLDSKQIFDDLAKFNIVPRKSKIYTFPEWLINHDLVHHFMRGYCDGDGSWYWQKHKTKTPQLIFSLRGTTEFLTKYRDILERELDIPKREKSIRINSEIGVLEYGGNGVCSKVSDFLYKDASVYLDRKRLI